MSYQKRRLAAERYLSDESHYNIIKAEQKRGKQKRRFIGGALIVSLALIISGVVYQFRPTRLEQFQKPAARSSGLSLTLAEINFFYNYYANKYINENYQSMQKNGYDFSNSPRVQKTDSGKTWFDFFVDLTKKNISDLIMLVSMAEVEGIVLEDTELDEIDTEIDRVKISANEKKQTISDYIASVYGKYVSFNDFQNCLRYMRLAEKYISIITSNSEYSEQELKAVADLSPEDYYLCDYKYYNVSDRSYAEELAKCTELSEFNNALLKYLRIHNPESDETSLIEKIIDTYVCRAAYNVSTQTGKWLFSDDRKKGDTMVQNEDDGTFTVYFLSRCKYLDDTVTKNFLAIQVSDGNGRASEKAASIFDSWKSAGGDKTAFMNLARRYSSDKDADNGQYINILRHTMPDVVDTWCFDEVRKTGDTTVIDSGYDSYILFFLSDGQPVWMVRAAAKLGNQTQEDIVAGIDKKYKPSFNDSMLKEIIPLIDSQ